MKRILRKVASILVATAMVAMLGMTALADETLPSGGVTGSKTSTLTTTLRQQKRSMVRTSPIHIQLPHLLLARRLRMQMV